MYFQSKILHYIIIVFFVAVIIFLGILDYPYLKKIYQKELAPVANNQSSEYLTKFSDTLEFKKFLPLMVMNGSKVIWYSIVSRTGFFQACKIHEEPKISFAVKNTSPVFHPVISIDIIDGLNCDKGNCYYKTIRLIAAQNECNRNSNITNAKSFADCSVVSNNIFQQGYFYPVYSDISVHYEVSCCTKGLCHDAKSFLIKKY